MAGEMTTYSHCSSSNCKLFEGWHAVQECRNARATVVAFNLLDVVERISPSGSMFICIGDNNINLQI